LAAKKFGERFYADFEIEYCGRIIEKTRQNLGLGSWVNITFAFGPAVSFVSSSGEKT
jgi:hypothetical protein